MQNTRPSPFVTQPGIDILQIIAPPPILFLLVILTSCVLNYLFPFELSNKKHMLLICGAMLFLLGPTFARWTFRSLQKAQTPAHLTTSGPFRYPRNPIYLTITGL